MKISPNEARQEASSASMPARNPFFRSLLDLTLAGRDEDDQYRCGRRYVP